MTRFCATHAPERTTEELEARFRELGARDMTNKPGLREEFTRVGQLLETRRLERATPAGILTEEMDGRPIDVAEDPEDAPILKAVIEEHLRRTEHPPPDPKAKPSADPPPPLFVQQFTQVPGETAYSLGWQDCIAYFRQLANGSTLTIDVLEVPVPPTDLGLQPDQHYEHRNEAGVYVPDEAQSDA